MDVLYSTGIVDYNKIKPDVIFNRFDLWPVPFSSLSTNRDGQTYSSLVTFNGTTAKQGLYLSDIPVDVTKAFCDYLFANNPNLKQIKLDYAKYPIGYAVEKNHWRIELPETKEELSLRLSKKSRYNTEREKKIIDNTFGGYSVKEYNSSECPTEIIDDFFRFKSKTHRTFFHVTSQEYLAAHHVTNVYVFEMGGVK